MAAVKSLSRGQSVVSQASPQPVLGEGQWPFLGVAPKPCALHPQLSLLEAVSTRTVVKVKTIAESIWISPWPVSLPQTRGEFLTP